MTSQIHNILLWFYIISKIVEGNNLKRVMKQETYSFKYNRHVVLLQLQILILQLVYFTVVQVSLIHVMGDTTQPIFGANNISHLFNLEISMYRTLPSIYNPLLKYINRGRFLKSLTPQPQGFGHKTT